MLANNEKSDSWRNTLKLISQCPVCNQNYKSEAVKLFAHESEANFVHFTCHNCHSYFMAMIMTMAKGVSTVGMVTDLSFTDVQKLYTLPAITIDEAIEASQSINNSDFFKKLSK
jgi:hypothetical protein